MKGKWIAAGILILILVGICGASLYAIWQGIQMIPDGGINIQLNNTDFKAEASEEKTLSVDGPVKLTINNDAGDISIEPGPDGQIHILAKKTGWGSSQSQAQKALDLLKVVIDQKGNTVNISAPWPEPVNTLTIGPLSGSVKFTISVPAETSVTLQSSNGDLQLSGTTGAADLQTDFGDAAVSDLTGALSIRTSNGQIKATNVESEGDVTLISNFGDIEVQGLNSAKLTIDSDNGQLDLQDIKASGLMTAQSDFGDLNLTSVQAPNIELTSTNGQTTLDHLDVDGKLTVRDDFGDIILKTVDSDAYDLKTQNGKIMMDKGRNSIKAHSDFGAIEVLNVENGTVDLSSDNGDVTFSGSLAEGPHSFTSQYGNIKLTLPAGTALNVDLKTDFGKITSDFELTVSGTLDKEHWVGKFNGGGENLTVETKNGNITINSQ